MKPRLLPPLAALACVICLPSISAAQTPPPCPTSAPDGFHKGTSCAITIDRENPASPATLVVRAGTSVTIVLKRARANESVAFTPTTTQTPPIDVAATFLKAAIPTLQSFGIHQDNYRALNQIPSSPWLPKDDPLLTELNEIIDDMVKTLRTMADASVQLSCLEGYRDLSGGVGSYSCADTNLTHSSYVAAKGVVTAALMAAAKTPLPAARQQDVEKKIDADFTRSRALTAAAARANAIKKDDELMSRNAVVKAMLDDAQKAQTTMLEVSQQLALAVDSPELAKFTISQGKNYTSTVTVVGQEVISKTNAAIATVTVNWQANPWEVSTGIMFSTLKSSSFSNAPLFANGQPQFDPDGKNLTIVTEIQTTPTIMAPLVMLSYRIRGLSNAEWENKCPGHCAVLISGGIGLNIPSTSAEFAVGPSFQIGGVLFTPGAHIGRETRLSQGVSVGDKLGSGAPSPLPTQSKRAVRFGFSVSYVLPF